MRHRVVLFFVLFYSVCSFGKDTELQFYRPYDGLQGEPIVQIKSETKGECWQQSHLIKREDAWRCSAEGKVLDPCFIKPYGSHPLVVCTQSPWTNLGIKILLNHAVDDSKNKALDFSKTYPWAVELTSGEKCQAIDEGKEFDNLPVRYQCEDQTWLIGHLQRCNPEWSILQKQSNGQVATVVLKRAWF